MHREKDQIKAGGGSGATQEVHHDQEAKLSKKDLISRVTQKLMVTSEISRDPQRSVLHKSGLYGTVASRKQ